MSIVMGTGCDMALPVRSGETLSPLQEVCFVMTLMALGLFFVEVDPIQI